LDLSGVNFAIGTEGDAVLVGRIGEAPRNLAGGASARNLAFGRETLTAVDGQGNMVAWRLSTGDLVPGQATFALVMVEARLITLRSLGSVVCRFRQAM
jgi:hypothetical protein